MRKPPSTRMVLAYELTAYQEIEVPAGLGAEDYHAKALEAFRKTALELCEGRRPDDLIIEEDTISLLRVVSIDPDADLIGHPALVAPVSFEEIASLRAEEEQARAAG